MKVTVVLPVGPPVLEYRLFRRGCSKAVLEEVLRQVRQETIRLTPRLEQPDVLFVYTLFHLQQHRGMLGDWSGGMSWDPGEPDYQRKIVREAFTDRISGLTQDLQERLTNRQYHVNLLFSVTAFGDTTSRLKLDALDPRTL